MNYLTIVKGRETGEVPPQAVFDAVEKMMVDQQQKGILLGWGGLKPSSDGARVRITGNKVNVTDGPFTESKEVIGGWSIIKAASREEAIQMAKAFMEMHVELWPGWEGECEIREVADFG